MSTSLMGKPDDVFTVDLDKLLAPISADQPSGESLRHHAVYDAIRESRKQDDTGLDRGVWQRDLKRADWNRVMLLCLEALETQTKDLQIAVWLLEAWTHLNGVAGAVEGLKLINGLCESFWDDLHPRIEDPDDLEVRVAPIQWLNDKVSDTLKEVPVTQPMADNARPYSWNDWEDAVHLASLKKLDPQAASAEEEKGKVSQEKFRASETLTPRPFYDRLAQRVGEARDELGTLDGFLESKCGPKSAPGLTRFRHTLEEIHNFTATVLKHREQQGEPSATEDETTAEATDFTEIQDDGEELFASGSGPIRSRAEAYRRLIEAADYLARTEPHSPTSFLVKRAVSWGSMTLAELLEELLQDGTDLRTIYKLLGMKPPPQD